MKSVYFGQCSCGKNIDKNNYPEETELDSNPSLKSATHWRGLTSGAYTDTAREIVTVTMPKEGQGLR